MRAVADQAKAAPSSSEQLAVAFRAAIFAQDGPPFWRIAFASSKRPSLSNQGRIRSREAETSAALARAGAGRSFAACRQSS